MSFLSRILVQNNTMSTSFKHFGPSYTRCTRMLIMVNQPRNKQLLVTKKSNCTQHYSKFSYTVLCNNTGCGCILMNYPLKNKPVGGQEFVRIDNKVNKLD